MIYFTVSIIATQRISLLFTNQTVDSVLLHSDRLLIEKTKKRKLKYKRLGCERRVNGDI